MRSHEAVPVLQWQPLNHVGPVSRIRSFGNEMQVTYVLPNRAGLLRTEEQSGKGNALALVSLGQRPKPDILCKRQTTQGRSTRKNVCIRQTIRGVLNSRQNVHLASSQLICNR